MVSLRTKPGERIIELGCGDNPNSACQVHTDSRPNSKIDFVCDLEKPFPIKDNDFQGVFASFALEHVSWRGLPQCISEMFRILSPSGKVVIITANTEAQIKYLTDGGAKRHKDGEFIESSRILFGDNDYPENSHKSFFSPSILTELFSQVGFVNIIIQPFGDLKTDLVLEATKPSANGKLIINGPPAPITAIQETPKTQPEPSFVLEPVATTTIDVANTPREELFDRVYFDGGNKVGGYGHPGYQDFPSHHIIAERILARQPESVLELGCARAYTLRRLQDRGVKTQGMDVSLHCYLTRACEPFTVWDAIKTPWPYGNKEFDLCFSSSFLEHIPEDLLWKVKEELQRVSKRGLHAVDPRPRDGFDKTRVTIKDIDWWIKHLPVNHEVVDKEELQVGSLPPQVSQGDGKVKINVGSFINQTHFGWTNIDVQDIGHFAEGFGYKYLRHDVLTGIPFNTGEVDLINHCHMLEHLSFEDGLKFLRECRRVLKPDSGVMRIIVPDAEKLISMYSQSFGLPPEKWQLNMFSQLNEGCEQASTAAGKLWSLLHQGHLAIYDKETLSDVLKDSGFIPIPSAFRQGTSECNGREVNGQQLVREGTDCLPELSLFMEAIPDVG